jgi:Ca2+-dependent lipid-binding protein
MFYDPNVFTLNLEQMMSGSLLSLFVFCAQ